MCSREFLIAYCWMMLYSVAQSAPVLPTPPLPVVSGGLLVPPARIEPTCWSIRIFCMQAVFGMFQPLSAQVALFGSVSVVTSCWSIWPTFSSSVMARRRASTRTGVGWLASSQGAMEEPAAEPFTSAGIARPAAVTAAVAIARVLLRLRKGGLISPETDMRDLLVRNKSPAVQAVGRRESTGRLFAL